jgi:hypothetical protein
MSAALDIMDAALQEQRHATIASTLERLDLTKHPTVAVMVTYRPAFPTVIEVRTRAEVMRRIDTSLEETTDPTARATHLEIRKLICETSGVPVLVIGPGKIAVEVREEPAR